MQEVKNVLMESTDIVPVINTEVKPKTEDRKGHKPTPVYENITGSPWDETHDKREYQKDSDDDDDDTHVKKPIAKQRISIHFDANDAPAKRHSQKWLEDEQLTRRNVQRLQETDTGIHSTDHRRYRVSGSLPRQLASHTKTTHDTEDYRRFQRDRSVPRTTQTTSFRQLSSGSEDEPLHRRIHDEENWEQELRIRRQRFMERLNAEEQGNAHEPVTRRSSAEGKIALLSGATGSAVMDAWTVSRDPRVSLPDSSCEPSDTEEDSSVKNTYEEMPGVVENNEEENMIAPVANVTVVVTGKLFKRESIVKSQASEEDPEYLLPERPKLVEQQQEHPFKKAWQIQKSRSEEDRPSAYAITEIKPTPAEAITKEHQSLQQLVEDTTGQVKNGDTGANISTDDDTPLWRRDSEDNETET